MTETTIAEIEREIREVDQLFRSFDDLLTRVKDEVPDLVEMTAVSTADTADAVVATPAGKLRGHVELAWRTL